MATHNGFILLTDTCSSRTI